MGCTWKPKYEGQYPFSNINIDAIVIGTNKAIKRFGLKSDTLCNRLEKCKRIFRKESLYISR